MKLAVAIVAVVLAWGCTPPLGAVEPPGRVPVVAESTGAWSDASGGLRGRLRVEPAAVAPGGPLRVTLDVENVGAKPLAMVLDDPMALSAKVVGADGAAVPSTGGRLEVLAAPSWTRVPAGAEASAVISLDEDAGEVTLDLTTRTWKLDPGSYRLRVVVRPGDAGKAPAGAAPWDGKLELPAVEFEVTR